MSALSVWAAAPPLVLAAMIGGMLAVTPLAGHPMWRTASLNMAEAAAARDVGTLAAMLERGEDPNLARTVRPPLLEGAANRHVTPLEAGVFEGRLEVVHLLLTHGARLDDGDRRRLACQARSRAFSDVAEYLAGDLAVLDCS
jgi:hypothetical protein